MAKDEQRRGGYIDEGTGKYPGPPAEVTVTALEHEEGPTGLVDAPPAEVTVTSPAGEEVTDSTGAHPGPPAEVTHYEWPAVAPAEETPAAKPGKKK